MPAGAAPWSTNAAVANIKTTLAMRRRYADGIRNGSFSRDYSCFGHSTHATRWRPCTGRTSGRLGRPLMNASFIAVMLVLSSFSAWAQHSHHGPHGGEIVDSSQGPFHVEFVVRANDLAVVVLDESNKPVAAAGSSGRVIVQDGGRTMTIPLRFEEPNRLAAKLSAPLGNGARVVLSGKLSDGRVFQARYVKR